MPANQSFPPAPSEGSSEFGDWPTISFSSSTPEPLSNPPLQSPPVDLYAETLVHQSPASTTPAASWPPATEANNNQQTGGFPPPLQQGFVPPPDLGGPPTPGAPGVMAAPPRKRRAGLIALIVGGLLVILVGTVAGVILLKKNAAASAPTCATLSGYTIFTSPDHTFCLAYPTGWQVTGALQGTGAQFSGPAHQLFTVSNIGAFSGTPADYDIRFCVTLDGTSSPTTTLTLSGQTWTQARCAINGGTGRGIVEATIYKGSLYHMDYGSPVGAFPSNRSQFFTPIEQSFRFLS